MARGLARGEFYHERWSWRSVPRPRLDVRWSGDAAWYVALVVSDGHSDPIWSIEWDGTLTPDEAAGWRGRMIDRLHALLDWAK